MIHFVYADTTSGEITNLCASDQEAAVILATWPPRAGKELVFCAPGAIPEPPDHYRVVDGAIVARAVMEVAVSSPTIAADGADTCILSGLPDPCEVTIGGVVSAGPVEVTGGELTLASTTPGKIRVQVRADPLWRAWEAVVDAA